MRSILKGFKSAGFLATAVGLGLTSLAQAHPGGGGGGGGHFGGGGGGGGGHAGGGHVEGGSHAAFGHFGGGARSVGAPHYAGGAHFAGNPHYSAVGTRFAGTSAVGHAYGGGYAGHPGAYGYGGGYHHGYSTGANWHGGYWHGGYWPRAYYGVGFAWFLPILPLAYATYWYGGVPYYYANDVYYTWNPDYSGYTATDPPPVSDDASGSALPPSDAPGPGATPSAAGAGSEIFMYPKNGQSEAQQSDDKRACQAWAASQAGAQNTADYRRAMLACVEGRGYSAN